MAAKKSSWQKGVSFGCAGRLGAQKAGFEPGENGYLTYQTAGATIMLIDPERTVIGALQLPPKCRVEDRTHSWTLRTSRFRAPAQPGCPAMDVTMLGSVLSPAVAFASETDRIFRWRWPVTASPQWMAYPVREGGAIVAHYSRGFPLHEFDPAAARMFEAGKFGPRREPPPGRLPWTGRWMITFDPGGPRNVPVLWVFARRPARVEVTNYEYMDVYFAAPFGRVLAMPMFGSAETDREMLAELQGGRGLDELRAWGDFWADVLLNLPDELDDFFRIDEAAGTVEVRDVGKRQPPPSGGGYSRTRGKALSRRPVGAVPIPPFLAAAIDGGKYPIRIDSPPLKPPRELMTRYGPYRVVHGGELRYTLPLCPYLDTVLSPVRIVGDRWADGMTARLREYFDDPKYTYGGDGVYDPNRLLDILHNLRVLAWAGWSLPDEQRPAAHAAIVRTFADQFNEGSYTFYREPVTGRTVARDRTIFSWCGDISYDFDWYSGMNLAGLFLGVYFGAIDERLVRAKWKLVCDIAAYFEVFQDWATLVPWTDMRGELLNIDCCRHGAQGMIGFARLADRFGDTRRRDLARLIASRYMAFWAAEHALPAVLDTGGVRLGHWGRHREEGSLVLGWGGICERDRRPMRITSAARNPYTLSPLNPEHMLWLRDYGPMEMLQKYESQVVDKEVPGWNRSPERAYLKDRPPGNIERIAGAAYFYMIDPHLLLRMLVLDWPARKAIGPLKRLSGKAMATALVAEAPKVLLPAGVTFAGTVWDARTKTLTIRGRAETAGRGKKPLRATWHILWPAAPKSVSGPEGFEQSFAGGKLTLAAECTGAVEWTVRYE